MTKAKNIEAVRELISKTWIEWYGEYPAEDFEDNMTELAEKIVDSIGVEITDKVKEFIWERCEADDYRVDEIDKELSSKAGDIIKIKERK